MQFKLGQVEVGDGLPPLVLPEVGINHNGDVNLAIRMAELAKKAGAKAIKYQCHIVDKEMIKTNMTPGEISDESLWDIIDYSSLSEDEERKVMSYCEQIGIQYLSTPFSREAADRLESMNLPGYKIGSGEITNLPLLEHIAGFKKPMILSTGMVAMNELDETVNLLKELKAEFMLLHCVSIYPTPYKKVNLGSIPILRDRYKVPVGLSDHSMGTYTGLAAVALGACLVEKHFTISRDMPGADQGFSLDPIDLKNLIEGAQAIFEASGTEKGVIHEAEKPVMNFARECVVAIRDIEPNEVLSLDNVWVKRPGTGEIPATKFKSILGKKANRRIGYDEQLKYQDLEAV